MFIRQNNGKLPKKRRNKEFAALTEDEVEQVETMYEEIFTDTGDEVAN